MITCGDDVAFVCSDMLNETVVGVRALVCAWKTNRGSRATLQSRKCQERGFEQQTKGGGHDTGMQCDIDGPTFEFCYYTICNTRCTYLNEPQSEASMSRRNLVLPLTFCEKTIHHPPHKLDFVLETENSEIGIDGTSAVLCAKHAL